MDALAQATQLISELQQRNGDLQAQLDIATGIRATASAGSLAKAAGVSEAAATEALRRGLRIQRRECLAYVAQKLNAAKKHNDKLMQTMHQKFKV